MERAVSAAVREEGVSALVGDGEEVVHRVKSAPTAWVKGGEAESLEASSSASCEDFLRDNAASDLDDAEDAVEHRGIVFRIPPVASVTQIGLTVASSASSVQSFTEVEHASASTALS